MNPLWLTLTAPLASGIVLSFLSERLVQPKIKPCLQKPLSSLMVHTSIWLVCFVFELALFRRPWFAALNVEGLLLLLIQVNNAKFFSLREPFIYCDFSYFTDTVKFPRLYLPFLGMLPLFLIVSGLTAILFTGLALESPITLSMSGAYFCLYLLGLLILSLSLLKLSSRGQPKLTLDPKKDLENLGLLASLWYYWKEDQKPIKQQFPLTFQSALSPSEFSTKTLPNLVVVQSESFFDARRCYAGIRPDLLQAFDKLKASAVYQGLLEVPIWGANTLRSEFAFLSCLKPDSLGVHRFHPYRKLARQGIPSIAAVLKKRGYRTVCVHPYFSTFYDRKNVFPLLGFDEFIDIRSFNHLEKAGPFFGDIPLAEKITNLLKASSDQPLFVFVITIENHGPLHLEKVQEGGLESLYLTPPPKDCEDLTVYLRHLKNADSMAKRLHASLEALPGPQLLCWYGDHVPIMPKVYSILGEPDGKTDYFIWQKGNKLFEENRLDLKIETLGGLLLNEMGMLTKNPN